MIERLDANFLLHSNAERFLAFEDFIDFLFMKQFWKNSLSERSTYGYDVVDVNEITTVQSGGR